VRTLGGKGQKQIERNGRIRRYCLRRSRQEGARGRNPLRPVTVETLSLMIRGSAPRGRVQGRRQWEPGGIGTRQEEHEERGADDNTVTRDESDEFALYTAHGVSGLEALKDLMILERLWLAGV
jgi:hypothetical protein